MLHEKLMAALEDARRAAFAADDHDRTYLEGKADGIAATLEAIGMMPAPWKPRPATRGWELVDGPTCRRQPRIVTK